MTVWVFGDSFSGEFEELKQHSASWIYFYHVAKSFNTELVNHSLPGTGLGYMYCKFNEYQDQFKKGDYIIITLTQLTRQYFFTDRPGLTTAWNLKEPGFDQNCKPTYFSKDEANAFKKKLLYLENSELDRVNLINFLVMVDYMVQLKQLGGVVFLPCFEEIYQVIKDLELTRSIVGQGWLFNISFNECVDEELSRLVFSRDRRICHMCRSNHEILYFKIMRSLKRGSILDLKSDFKVKILDRAGYESNCNRELISYYMDGDIV